MAMGAPVWNADALETELDLSSGKLRAVVLNVGNPQCAVFVPHFGLDWRSLGREIETHGHFPKRTNVSFIRVLDEHHIDVRFWERGAGETLSSGTGSTGAAAAAILSGRAKSPGQSVDASRRDGSALGRSGLFARTGGRSLRAGSTSGRCSDRVSSPAKIPSPSGRRLCLLRRLLSIT